MKTNLQVLMFVLLLSFTGRGQQSAYTDYITAYAPMAVEQMHRHGVPASITLAQGLLESAAGQSTLATEGNNHFGIKCHSTWNGPTMLRSDDAPDECFRVYPDAADSFEDHSLFLCRSRRYAPLFALDPTDFRGWAEGLSACGYATDPNYAARLTAIIERYGLYVYDSPETQSDEAAALFIMEQLRAARAIRCSRGLHYVIAVPGDTYASLAHSFSLNSDTLAAYNDALSPYVEIKAWEEVYLQPKLDTAPKGVNTVTIGQDECAHSLSQRYGVKMELIERLNPGFKDCPGTRLKLTRQ